MPKRRLDVVIDHQIFARQRVGGVSRYFCELARRIVGMDRHDLRIVAPFHVNEYLHRTPGLPVTGFHVSPIPGTARVRRLLSHAVATAVLTGLRPDVVHETYYHRARGYRPGTRRILTVYDLIAERLPEFFGPTARTEKTDALRGVDHVVCISNRTREDLLEFYNVAPDRVSVVAPACSFETFEATAVKPVKADGPFLLYVGVRNGYKNFNRLLRAFAVSGLSRDFRLLCFGGGRLTPSEWELIGDLGLPPGSVSTLTGDDQQLAACYRDAIALVYPSLYEGFGLPLLEAMFFGCPVVCSNAGSLPEVAQGAAAYFDARSVEGMAATIRSVITSAERRVELIAAGCSRVGAYSWEQSAQKLDAVYRASGDGG